MTPIEKWKWYGLPGHCIVGDRCVHHLCTEVGKHLVSTIGEYRPNAPRSKERDTIGADRYFETFVFKTIGGRCECGCGMPQIDLSEIDSLPANDAATADRNHMKLCKKYSRS